MKLLDTETVKNFPPTDKRMNLYAFVGSILSVSLLGVFFAYVSISVVWTGNYAYFIFPYIIFPLECVLIISVAAICIKQLSRNVYNRIIVTAVLITTALVAMLLFIIAFYATKGVLLLPFAYTNIT